MSTLHGRHTHAPTRFAGSSRPRLETDAHLAAVGRGNHRWVSVTGTIVSRSIVGTDAGLLLVGVSSHSASPTSNARRMGLLHRASIRRAESLRTSDTVLGNRHARSETREECAALRRSNYKHTWNFFPHDERTRVCSSRTGHDQRATHGRACAGLQLLSLCLVQLHQLRAPAQCHRSAYRPRDALVMVVFPIIYAVSTQARARRSRPTGMYRDVRPPLRSRHLCNTPRQQRS